MVMFDAKLIRELRKSLGMTAKQFGDRLGVTQNTVFRWESETGEEASRRYPSRRHQKIMNEMLKDANGLQVA